MVEVGDLLAEVAEPVAVEEVNQEVDPGTCHSGWSHKVSRDVTICADVRCKVLLSQHHVQDMMAWGSMAGPHVASATLMSSMVQGLFYRIYLYLTTLNNVMPRISHLPRASIRHLCRWHSHLLVLLDNLNTSLSLLSE